MTLVASGTDTPSTVSMLIGQCLKHHKTAVGSTQLKLDAHVECQVRLSKIKLSSVKLG